MASLFNFYLNSQTFYKKCHVQEPGVNETRVLPTDPDCAGDPSLLPEEDFLHLCIFCIFLVALVLAQAKFTTYSKNHLQSSMIFLIGLVTISLTLFLILFQWLVAPTYAVDGWTKHVSMLVTYGIIMLFAEIGFALVLVTATLRDVTSNKWYYEKCCGCDNWNKYMILSGCIVTAWTIALAIVVGFAAHNADNVEGLRVSRLDAAAPEVWRVDPQWMFNSTTTGQHDDFYMWTKINGGKADGEDDGLYFDDTKWITFITLIVQCFLFAFLGGTNLYFSCKKKDTKYRGLLAACCAILLGLNIAVVAMVGDGGVSWYYAKFSKLGGDSLDDDVLAYNIVDTSGVGLGLNFFLYLFNAIAIVLCLFYAENGSHYIGVPQDPQKRNNAIN